MQGQPFRTTLRSPTQTRNFKQEFQFINSQNQQLIQVADQIARSSFMHPSHPHLISQLEQQLRRNLSIFVDSIRDFFVDLDNRLRALAEALDQQIRRQQQHSRKRLITQQHEDPRSRQLSTLSYGIRNKSPDPYQMFAAKIEALQVSLKQTQENEGKLIEIVEKLSKNSEHLGSTGEQTEPPRYVRPELKQNIERYGSTHNFESDHESSFRLFSLKNQSKRAQDGRQRVNRIPERATTSTSMVCGSVPHEKGSNPQVNFGQVYPRNAMDSTHNHNHRVNFMLRTLNS